MPMPSASPFGCNLIVAREALGTPRIFTLDRRHFSTYRLYDCESFEIVPEA